MRDRDRALIAAAYEDAARVADEEAMACKRRRNANGERAAWRVAESIRALSPDRLAESLPRDEEATKAQRAALVAIAELDSIKCGSFAGCEGPCERAVMVLLPIADPNHDPDEDFDARKLLARLDVARARKGDSK